MINFDTRQGLLGYDVKIRSTVRDSTALVVYDMDGCVYSGFGDYVSDCFVTHEFVHMK